MRLQWYGHSCFSVESGGYRVVLDPYRMKEYPELRVSAHRVLCSHDHFDHNAVDAVTLLPAGDDPFTVEKVPTFHDEKQGALRGKNTIHILRAEGLCVAHCGDLGHALSEERLALLKGCDALLVPVGGFFTVDARAAKALCDAAEPRVIVPMHYRHGKYGLRQVAELDEFLRLFDPAQVHRLEGNAFELMPDAPHGVIVPQFAEA